MEMPGIGSIEGIGSAGGARGLAAFGAVPRAADSSDAQGTGFGALLEGLGAAQAEADRALIDLAVGGDRDLHDVMLAVEMESIAFELATQIRNRLVDAYQEIFRMSV